jgi:hypothetical protein
MSIINITTKAPFFLFKARHSAGFRLCANFGAFKKNSDRNFLTDAIAKNF